MYRPDGSVSGKPKAAIIADISSVLFKIALKNEPAVNT